MKKLAFLIILCFVFVDVFSQGSPDVVDVSKFGSPISGPGYINRTIVNQMIHDIDKINRLTPEEREKKFFNSIVGTPYMENEFSKGEILTTDSQSIKDISLRYNVYNNIFEVDVNNVRYELTNEIIDNIKLAGKTFEYLPFQIGNDKEEGFLELLLSVGDMKLYCRHSKKFKDAEPQKAMEDRPSPPEFKDLPEVYLLMSKNDKLATGFRNKKNLISAFPNYHDEIKNHLKEKKLKHNDPDDLKELLSYYNSL